MKEKLIKALFDSVIEIGVGAYLLYFRFNKMKKNPNKDPDSHILIQKYDMFLKYGGIALIAFGIFMFIKDLLS